MLLAIVFTLYKFSVIKLNNQQPIYYLEVNLTPEAKKVLEDRIASNMEMLKLFPKNYEVYMDLGNIERELGEASKAIEYFTNAWEIIPTNSTPWINIGNIYIRLGLYEKAEEAFLKAVNTNSAYYLTYYNLAKLYKDYLTDKADQVKSVFLEGLKNTQNDYQLLQYFTDYLIESNNYSEALLYLQVLQEKVPAINKNYVIERINSVQELINQQQP